MSGEHEKVKGEGYMAVPPPPHQHQYGTFEGPPGYPPPPPPVMGFPQPAPPPGITGHPYPHHTSSAPPGYYPHGYQAAPGGVPCTIMGTASADRKVKLWLAPSVNSS